MYLLIDPTDTTTIERPRKFLHPSLIFSLSFSNLNYGAKQSLANANARKTKKKENALFLSLQLGFNLISFGAYQYPLHRRLLLFFLTLYFIEFDYNVLHHRRMTK